jgi:hypothetical protein
MCRFVGLKNSTLESTSVEFVAPSLKYNHKHMYDLVCLQLGTNNSCTDGGSWSGCS